jgi:hypothetical protein
MRNWKWPGFRRLLDFARGRQKRVRADSQSWLSGWGPAAGKIAIVVVILAIFGTLAYLIIAAIVRFFGGFFHQFDEAGLL